jgi:hypothetical protein
MSDIANADEQGNFILNLKKDTARTNMPDGSPPGLVGSANSEAYYGFAADAALAAASAAALAAAAESAAAEAAESAAGGGGGAAAGAGASVLLPQALNMNAATKAVRASLVFIYRYPGNIKGKKIQAEQCCFWAYTQTSRAILECFGSISYLFRLPRRAFNAANRSRG